MSCNCQQLKAVLVTGGDSAGFPSNASCVNRKQQVVEAGGVSEHTCESLGARVDPRQPLGCAKIRYL